MTSREELFAALERVYDPELRRPITELGMVGKLEMDAAKAIAEIKLTVVGCPASERIKSDVLAALSSVAGVNSAQVNLGVMTADERAELAAKLTAGRPPKTNPFGQDTLTRVILVGSGKGGVGKTSVTVNLAVELASQGFSVGLLDADVFGFSVPGQLGLTDKPIRIENLIVPPVAFGVKVISIGMFVDGNQAVAWRGPMLHRTVEQFLTDVYWGDLDFLLVDLPPGTGDVAISLGQLLPTGEHLVVTTPQLAAAQVAERSAAVGLQTGQSLLGVIENMAWLPQPDGSRFELFGSGGGELVARALGLLAKKEVSLLGQIPMDVSLREGSDAGRPIVAADSNSLAAKEIAKIAKLIVANGPKLMGKKLPLSAN